MLGDNEETLGAVAHRGGFLVKRPELAVWVVQAISRSTGLELDLVARRPLDRRTATERQRDVRHAERPAPAPRRLLPAFDEGLDLRLGTLDDAGRAHWEFPFSESSSSGDNREGRSGPWHRFVFRFPPTFDEVSLVLAWPEIGFPETVVTVVLPDRATVERATRSIWEAPVTAVAPAEDFEHHLAPHVGMDVDGGTVAAPQQVLHRGDDAAIVLTRVAAVDAHTLSVSLSSIARGDVANTIQVATFPPGKPPSRALDQPDVARSEGPGASIAVVAGGKAFWVRPNNGAFHGGDDSCAGTQDFAVPRPHDDVLDVLVAWPLAGLPDARARIPLNSP